VPQAEHQLYVKSHANYDPGEQRHRGYVWKSKEGDINPAQYRFGGLVRAPLAPHAMRVQRVHGPRCVECAPTIPQVEKGEINGVGKAMNPMLDEKVRDPGVAP
jgi:hypothetical protein